MKISRILKGINYKELIGNEEVEIKDFSKDTRTINEGDIYVGIKGENFDGNTFYNKAFEAGASACLLDNIEVTEELRKYVLDNNKAIIIVENTLVALAEHAASIRNSIDIPVVAITGSAGKTSTKDIIASVISTKYNTLKSEQNYNNEIGCPLSISRYTNEEVMVLEMGAQYVGEIDSYCKYARPTIGVITNVGTAHIGAEFFGSRENILKGKTEIINYMDENGVLIINNDNDMLHKYYLDNKDNSKVRIVTIGIENESDIMPTDINILEDHSTFKVDGKEIRMPISGQHFIYNALEAIAVARELGIDLDSVQKGLNSLEMSKNRMDIIKKENNITIINDAYNANAEAMEYAIKYLGNMKTRKVAVLGSMLELGDYTKELHEKVARACLENKIDVVITIGKEMEYASNYLKENGFNENYHFDTKENVLEFLKEIMQENDTILIKGSNGLALFNMVDEL